MTNLIETPVYETGIFQLETNTPVIGGQPGFSGGVPVVGHSNAQAQQLANRTTFLKAFKDDLGNTSDVSKGANLIGYMGRSVTSRLKEQIYSTDYPTVAAFRSAVVGGGVNATVVGDINLDSTLTISNNTILQGKPNSHILPPASPTAIVSARGVAPSVFYTATSNILKDSTQFTASQVFQQGNWVEFRSDALVAGPNTQGVKFGSLRKIVEVNGSVYTLNKPLDYDFLTTDNAVYGIATVLENIIIRDLEINKEDYTNITSISLDFLYCAHVTIENFTTTGSKARFGPDFSPRSGIKINNCFDVRIVNTKIKHQAWYGIEILGMAEDIVIEKPFGYDCRHTVSINWSGPYGQPVDVTTKDGVSWKSSLSGFDCHDVGLRIKYINCKAYLSGDDGFQMRVPNGECIDCYSYKAANDGFSGLTGATGIKFKACTSDSNGRSGYNLGYEGGTLENCNASGNVSAGAIMLGGTIVGGTWVNNNFAFDCGGNFSVSTPQYPLLIERVNAPFSASQPRLLFFRGANTRLTELVTLLNSSVVGYVNNMCIAQGYGSIPIPPVSIGNILDIHTAPIPTSGFATLVAGTVLVSTAAVHFTNPASGTALATMPKIRLSLVLPGGTVGSPYVSNISNGIAFRITSTSASDTSIYKWEMTY